MSALMLQYARRVDVRFVGQSGQSAFVEATALSRLSLMTAFAVRFVPQSRHSRPMVRHRKHSVH